MLLIGRNIIIRDFKEEDFEPFFTLLKDKTNHDLAGLEYTEDPDFAKKLFTLYQKRDDAHVIAQKDTDLMVGIFEINKRGESIGLAQTREIGFVIGKAYRKKSYATESVNLVINYGFNRINLTEIWASTEESNKVPQKILEKLKFKYIYSAQQTLPFTTQSQSLKYYLLKK
ncbi:GNAT family N-acetyltransferase [Companilactobacillus sp. HBUAS56257]|uniref:GNAT family N-acetyltransferase n=1 Tax=Companilactobacillus sp. HBUAS56257 TaxID=3109360 RepID=UPI002FF2CB5C